MNPISIELTMQDLLQMALGVPKITDFNLSILQSLLDLILKKLDCEHETVSVTGYESQQLQQLLRQSRISPLPFKVEKMDTLPEKIERLSALEDRIAAITKKFDDHITEILKCNEKKAKHESSYVTAHWQHYSRPDEDLCTVPTDENLLACKVASNHNFNVWLIRLVAIPLKNRLLQSAQKVESLHLQLLDFTRLAHERYKKIMLVDGCPIEIEHLRNTVLEEEDLFKRTIAEIQEQIETKVKKVFITELRFHMRKLVVRMQKFVDALKASETCPGKPKPPKSNTTECVSCGGVNKCAERPFHVCEPHNWDRMTIPTPRQYCGCLRACLDSVQQEALRQHLKEVALHRDADSLQPYLTCLPPQTTGELRGTDGAYYLKG